jgi:hypothetical protein
MTTRDTHDIQEAKRMDLYEKLLEITKWHAQLQIDFERELFSNKENTFNG